MIKREITICGKQVTLGYCFATEIGYRANADEDIETFITEVVEMFTNHQAVPDRQKCIYLIYASILAYYQSRKEDTPISAEDMMYYLRFVTISSRYLIGISKISFLSFSVSVSLVSTELM